MYYERANLFGTVPALVRCPSTPDEFKRTMSTYVVQTRYIRRYLKIIRNRAAVLAWADSQLRKAAY